jgi:hypothetical protein
MRSALTLVLLVVAAHADGLAARYPADEGIAKDPAVLFRDDFERGDRSAVAKRWGSAKPDSLKLVEDGPAGKRCVEMAATRGKDTGSHLYTVLKRPVDQAYARFYVKFPKDAGYIHHFVHFGGYFPATRWPQGGAGERPRGDERITVGIEPWGRRGRAKPPGEWGFYAYWHEMKISADGKYWGNGIRPIKPAPVPRATWQCVEVMIKLNTPGKRDGELALWLDGKQTMHVKKGTPRTKWTGMGFTVKERGGEPFEGFSWRTDAKLKLNFFWLLHYVTEGALRRNRVKNPPKENRVRFDHVVVATKYVGPLAK